MPMMSKASTASCQILIISLSVKVTQVSKFVLLCPRPTCVFIIFLPKYVYLKIIFEVLVFSVLCLYRTSDCSELFKSDVIIVPFI